jgi:hypothetical protein
MSEGPEPIKTSQSLKIVQQEVIINQQAERIEQLKRIIDPHLDADGNFDKQGFDWKCLEWESEIERLKHTVDCYEKTIGFMSEKMNNQRRRLKHFEQKGQDNEINN